LPADAAASEVGGDITEFTRTAQRFGGYKFATPVLYDYFLYLMWLFYEYMSPDRLALYVEEDPLKKLKTTISESMNALTLLNRLDWQGTQSVIIQALHVFIASGVVNVNSKDLVSAKMRDALGTKVGAPIRDTLRVVAAVTTTTTAAAKTEVVVAGLSPPAALEASSSSTSSSSTIAAEVLSAAPVELELLNALFELYQDVESYPVDGEGQMRGLGSGLGGGEDVEPVSPLWEIFQGTLPEDLANAKMSSEHVIDDLMQNTTTNLQPASDASQNSQNSQDSNSSSNSNSNQQNT
jgi:hypothetical protein